MQTPVKTFGSKKLFRRSIFFSLIFLLGGVCGSPFIQSMVKAEPTNGSPDPIITTPCTGNPPLIVLLTPTEGEILKETQSIQWTAQDTEDGMNLSIYLYLNNADNNNLTFFMNNPNENTGQIQWNTTQNPDGDFLLTIEARDSDGNLGVDSCTVQIKNHGEQTINNEPIKPDQPFGRVYNKIGVECPYTTCTLDADGDLVYYLWIWGDGTTSGWLGPYHSGINCEARHAWMEIGIYSVMVKAKDINGQESLWSDPLFITIPQTYNPILHFLELVFQQFPYAFPFLQKLLGY